MPLDRVRAQRLGAPLILWIHRGVRVFRPLHRVTCPERAPFQRWRQFTISSIEQILVRRAALRMRAPWRWVPLPRHTAEVEEILEVLWSDYYGAALFGDGNEIACLPYKGCRLEVVATAESSHAEVNLILPGQVVRYKGAFCFLDRLALPSGTTVGLWHLVGFKLRLAPGTIAPVPSERALPDRARGKAERVPVG